MTDKKILEARSNCLDVEINLVYMMAMGMERLIDDIEKRLRTFERTFHREKKQRFSNIIRACEAVKKNADIIDQTDYAEGLKGKEDVWMGYYENGLYLTRLLLLVCDRVSADRDAYEGIADYLLQLKAADIVTDKDLDRFKIR